MDTIEDCRSSGMPPLSYDDLAKIGFVRTEIEIKLIDKRAQLVEYVCDTRNDKELFSDPGIYIIGCRDKYGNLIPIYVGKAGKGINKRFSEHSGGYERTLRKGIPSAGAKKLIAKFSEYESNTFEIWFRRSSSLQINEVFGKTALFNDMPKECFVSTYSLEEEALIKYLQLIGVGLINRTIPPEIDLKSVAEKNLSLLHKDSVDRLDFFNCNILEPLSETQEIHRWTEDTRLQVNDVLKSFFETEFLTTRHSAKIIAKYSGGPFRYQKVIAFGEPATRKFKGGSVKLILTIDGKYLAKWPFNIKKIYVSSLVDYCAAI